MPRINRIRSSMILLLLSFGKKCAAPIFKLKIISLYLNSIYQALTLSITLRLPEFLRINAQTIGR